MCVVSHMLCEHFVSGPKCLPWQIAFGAGICWSFQYNSRSMMRYVASLLIVVYLCSVVASVIAIKSLMIYWSMYIA